MPEQPDETLLRRAAHRAQRQRRSVYVYHDTKGWKLADKLSDTRESSQIIEVAYQGRQGETRNWGGC